jgi:hypothetical protein
MAAKVGVDASILCQSPTYPYYHCALDPN